MQTYHARPDGTFRLAQNSAAVWTSACSRLSARCGNERPRPISQGPVTVSVAIVRSGAEASRRSSASIRSPVSWKTSRSGREAAPVGLDGGDPGPPVGEVARLGEEGPDVLARRKELARGLNARHAQSLR